MFKEEEGKGDVEAGGIEEVEDHWIDAVCCEAEGCDKGAFRNETCFVSLCVAKFQFIKDIFQTMNYGLA